MPKPLQKQYKPNFTQRNGMSILTFHSEDGEFKYHRLTQALKEADASKIAEEVEIFKGSGKNPLTNDLPYKFKKVADCLLTEILPWEADSRRGFVPSAPLSTQETKLEGVAIETWKLAKTHTIKFQQKYKDIPVYGAQVNVEIDEENELLAINSAVGASIGDIDRNPTIKSNELKDLIQKTTKHDLKNSHLEFTLYYYFDSANSQDKENKPQQEGQWRLVYLVKNTIDKQEKVFDPKMFQAIQKMVDYVVDAHTGELVSELSRLKTIR